MTTQLTATQTEILKIAAYRPEGQIEPLPTQLRGGARIKVIDGLLARNLIGRETETAPYCLTDAGYAAVGRSRPQIAAIPANETGSADAPREVTENTRRPRENSKQAKVIEMLKRPEGATIQQICETTGWQAHTVRGAFAGTFKKRLGLNLVSEKNSEGNRVYRAL